MNTKSITPRLSKVLIVDFDHEEGVGKLSAREERWWFVDSYGTENRVALFGGFYSDPDSFDPWTKNGPAER